MFYHPAVSGIFLPYGKKIYRSIFPILGFILSGKIVFSGVCPIQIQLQRYFIVFCQAFLSGGSFCTFVEINLLCITGKDQIAVIGVIEIGIIEICQCDFFSFIIGFADPPGYYVKRDYGPG